MSYAEQLSTNYGAIRNRLYNNKRAVADDGIDLKRKPRPKPKVVYPGLIELVHEAVRNAYLQPPDAASMVMPEPPPVVPRHAPIRTIQDVVCAFYGLPRVHLLSNRRSAGIVRPRQIAMYLCRKLTPQSLPSIGRQFGGMDHSSVHHAAGKIEELRHTDPDLDREVLAIMHNVSELGFELPEVLP